MSDEKLPKEHPSYVCVEVARVSGGDFKLFGSDVPHNHKISLRIKPAERSDVPGQTHTSGMASIVELEMSYQQFGRLMSSTNLGAGVPATLRRMDGELVEKPPSADRGEKYKIKAEKKVDEVTDRLDALENEIRDVLDPEEGGYVNKGDRKQLLKKVEKIRTEIESNLPYLLQSLQEQIEKTVAEARSDIDAYTGRAKDFLKQFAEGSEFLDSDTLKGLIGDG